MAGKAEQNIFPHQGSQVHLVPVNLGLRNEVVDFHREIEPLQGADATGLHHG